MLFNEHNVKISRENNSDLWFEIELKTGKLETFNILEAVAVLMRISSLEKSKLWRIPIESLNPNCRNYTKALYELCNGKETFEYLNVNWFEINEYLVDIHKDTLESILEESKTLGEARHLLSRSLHFFQLVDSIIEIKMEFY